MNNHFLLYLSKAFVQVFLDILYFPLWWYSLGLLRFLGVLFVFLKEKWIIMGVGLWLKNIFTPMYGQRDLASRSISFFIRFFQIIFRFIAFLFFLSLSILALLTWIFFPLTILYLTFIRI